MDAPMSTEALGRPLTPGVLYDCRSDKLVPGVTLWDRDALRNNVTSDRNQHSAMHVFASDSISDKADALKVSADLKLSVLGGLVRAKGAGSYFQDFQESAEIVRVTLKYESSSHFEKLNMEHLGPGNCKYPEVIDRGDATHVVTEVEYGADAFFVFEKASSECISSKKLHGELHAVVMKIITKIIAEDNKGAVEIDVQKHEKEHTENITCKFHGDFQLDTIPTTYQQALQTIQRLPQLLKENRPVPKTVHLYPLCKLDIRAAKLVRSISESLIDRVEYILQQASDLRAQVSGLCKSPVSAVPFLQQDLDDYIRVLCLSSSVFKTELLTLLPSIRGGTEEEKKLDTMLSVWENSITAPRNLKSVLDGMKHTINWIKSLLSAAQQHGLREAFGPDLEELTLDNTDLTVCFTLNRDVLASKGLPAISSHLHDNRHTPMKLPKEWHVNDRLKTIIKERFLLFREYAKLNKDRPKKIEYVLTDGEDVDSGEPAVIQVVEGGQEIINLANAPGKPYLTGETTTNEAYIEWEHPTEGNDTVKGYIIWYCLIGDETDSWKSVEIDAIPRHLMTNLKPGIKYVFKVQANTKAGLSPKSPVSDPVPMEAETRLAIRIFQQCRKCTDSNKEVKIYTPKDRLDLSHGPRVKKYEIGEKRAHRVKEKTILMVGATGTGKTTFLNSMVNYLMGVRLTDNFRFKLITQEDEGQESATSVTKNVTAYVLHDTILPYTLTVVDTPGYGDTEGLKADKETTNLIKQLFETKRDIGGIDQLDAVCLVVKSTDSKLTSHQLYNFNSVQALFSADMADNVIIIITFSDTSTPPVILALKEGEVCYKEFYKFNNNAFFQAKRNDRLGDAAQQFYWELGQTSFKAFFEGLKHMWPKSLALSVEVLNRREKLENLVIHLQQQVNSGINDLETMHQEAMTMEKFEAKINANENFKYTVTEGKFVKEEICGKSKQYTTTCMNCSFTCHDNCSRVCEWSKQFCCAMDWSGNCTVCPGKCKYDMHKNMPYIFKFVTETVTRTDEELRRKYAESQDDFQQKDNLMSNLCAKFGAKEMDIHCTIKLINDTLNQLNEIAMQPDHLTNMDYIEGLIESEKMQKKRGWKQRVQYLNDQKDLALKCQQSKDPSFDPFWEDKQEKGSWWKRHVKSKLEKLWNWNLPVEGDSNL